MMQKRYKYTLAASRLHSVMKSKLSPLSKVWFGIWQGNSLEAAFEVSEIKVQQIWVVLFPISMRK